MATTSPSIATMPTLADLLESLGSIDPRRVLACPAPGQATEADLREAHLRTNRLFELVDGALVEKAAGFRESVLAAAFAGALRAFVVPKNLGLVSGPDGFVCLTSGLIRIPDVAYVSWDRIPGRRVPEAAIPRLVPDLAVEILSEGNTAREMERKVSEYFRSGVRLVWLVDPRTRCATVYDSVQNSARFDESQSLGGGEVLAGFLLPLSDLFSELDRHRAH